MSSVPQISMIVLLMLDALWPVFFEGNAIPEWSHSWIQQTNFFCKKNKSFWKSTFTKEWYNVKNSMMTSYIFEERQIRNCRLVWGFLKSWLKTVNRFLYLVISVSIDYTLKDLSLPVQWCILSLTNQCLQKSDDISPRMGFSKPWITCERIHFDISKNNAL